MDASEQNASAYDGRAAKRACWKTSTGLRPLKETERYPKSALAYFPGHGRTSASRPRGRGGQWTALQTGPAFHARRA